ncbi:DUF4129 domain-containing protein [Mangrovihabitans endophyticus]|uniref:Protein-glutamine gamma-glutamyltransferase-like C-terminal domain-containing protein n=1 Tax=Mangrovihabitans endophyticus TaxID=1751298 RepID=A0A8J3C236_9ACTN|nr:DUF4129 domain-containing protein [Mangrovihabitans endophyticus]GGL06783.1 hypothetical protein GCM10012284_46210 [Mangrovihabitans endophyticus]
MDLAVVRRWWPLAAVLGLLFLTSLAATRSAPQLDRFDPNPPPTATPPPLLPPAPDATAAAPTSAPTPEAADGLPDWVGTAALVVLVVLAFAVVVVAVTAIVRDQMRRAMRRSGRRAPRREPNRTAEEVVAALDAGLEELSDTDRDPRRAVIACWVRLEQAAAAAGTTRHPGDTPADLVGRLLAEQQVDARLLAAMAEVYRQARYATRSVDDQMRAQARDALARLRADLGATAVTG